MLKILILISSLVFICYAVFVFSEPSRNQAVDHVLERTANQLKQRFGLETIGTGGSASEGKESMIGIEFQIKRSLSFNEARKMIIESANLLLNNINSDKYLSSYLSEVPFTQKNIEITIYISGKNHERIFDPDITLVSFDNGKITFKTLDPEDHYKYKSRIVETYEEALQKLKDENRKL